MIVSLAHAPAAFDSFDIMIVTVVFAEAMFAAVAVSFAGFTFISLVSSYRYTGNIHFTAIVDACIQNSKYISKEIFLSNFRCLIKRGFISLK